MEVAEDNVQKLLKEVEHAESLKPCPFCGAEYYITDDEDCYLTIDHKPNCLFNFFGERYMTTRIQKNFRPGIDAWNRRAK